MKRLVLYAQPALMLLFLGAFSIFFFGNPDVLPHSWPPYTGHTVYHRAADSWRAKPAAVIVFEEQEENEDDDDHQSHVSHPLCFFYDSLFSTQSVHSHGLIVTLSSAVALESPYLVFRVLRL